MKEQTGIFACITVVDSKMQSAQLSRSSSVCEPVETTAATFDTRNKRMQHINRSHSTTTTRLKFQSCCDVRVACCLSNDNAWWYNCEISSVNTFSPTWITCPRKAPETIQPNWPGSSRAQRQRQSVYQCLQSSVQYTSL